MKHAYLVILLSLLFVITSGFATAQTYKIDWCCISSGGGEVAGGSYKLNGTIGQPAAGFVSNSGNLHWIGFWAGEVTLIVASNTQAAKLLANGTFVSVGGRIATTDAADFGSYFYIEEPDKSSGLRVAVSTASISGLARGKTVNVIGTMDTTSDGERQIKDPLIIVTASPLNVLSPIGMNTAAIGGCDIGDVASGCGQCGVVGGIGTNNIGLLIQTWGEVVSADSSYISIRDGFGAQIWVKNPGLDPLPVEGDTLCVAGISTFKPASGHLPMILPRQTSDIEPEPMP